MSRRPSFAPLFACLFFAVGLSSAHAVTLQTPDACNFCNDPGDAANLVVPSGPFPNLTSAIAAAGGLDTIEIVGSLPAEAVTVTKRVCIIGAPGGSPHAQRIFSATSSPTLTILEDGVCVKGLTIDKTGTGDVITIGNPSTRVDDVGLHDNLVLTTSGATGSAIKVFGRMNEVVGNVLIGDGDIGIWLDGDMGNTENLIFSNTLNRHAVGIALSWNSTGTGLFFDMAANEIAYNRIQRADRAIFAQGQEIFSINVEVRDNVYYQNVISEGVGAAFNPVGIYLIETSNELVEGNVISGYDTGVLLEGRATTGLDSLNNTLKDNRIQASVDGVKGVGLMDDIHFIGNDISTENAGNTPAQFDGIDLFEACPFGSLAIELEGGTLFSNDCGLNTGLLTATCALTITSSTSPDEVDFTAAVCAVDN
ncbi:MAG: hypothetical protein AAF533_10950 [Acidobacteriota bacterium]